MVETKKPSHISIEFGDCGIGFLSFFDMQNSAPKAIWKSDRALVAQLVERVLGKDEVTGSSPVKGSSIK